LPHARIDTSTISRHSLSLHDALPISRRATHAARRATQRNHTAGVPDERLAGNDGMQLVVFVRPGHADLLDERYLSRGPEEREQLDRKSTRLNSSHQINAYAVFCLK